MNKCCEDIIILQRHLANVTIYTFYESIVYKAKHCPTCGSKLETKLEPEKVELPEMMDCDSNDFTGKINQLIHYLKSREGK